MEFAFIFTSQNINRNQSCPNELPILLSNDILSIFTKAHVDWRLSGLVWTESRKHEIKILFLKLSMAFVNMYK